MFGTVDFGKAQQSYLNCLPRVGDTYNSFNLLVPKIAYTNAVYQG
jgi:hypothetical protein